MSVTTPGLGPWATEIPACGEFCILRTIRDEADCLQARNLSCFCRPAAQEAISNDNAVLSCIWYDCFDVGVPDKSDLAALCDDFEFIDGGSSISTSATEHRTQSETTTQAPTKSESTHNALTFQGVATTRTEDPEATVTPVATDPEPKTTDGPATPKGLSPGAKGGIAAGVVVAVLGMLLVLFILRRRRMKSAPIPCEATAESEKGKKPCGVELNGDDTRYVAELDSQTPRGGHPVELEGIRPPGELPTSQYRGHDGGTAQADTADGPSRG